MCNINLVFRKDRKVEKRLNSVINTMSYESFKDNDDAQGFLGLIETEDGLEYYLEKTYNNYVYSKPSFLIMSHQRLATSGLKKPELNTQPLESKDLIILHNGVLSELGAEKKSDTHMLLKDLQKKYDETKDTIKTIKEVMKEVSGSFSILLFNKETNQLYYFKNDYTSMFKVSNSKYIVLSTSKENADYASCVLGINKPAKDVTAKLIYDVFDDFVTVGEIKCKSWNYYGYDYDDESISFCGAGMRNSEKTVASSYTSNNNEESKLKHFVESYYNARIIDIINTAGIKDVRLLVRTVDLDMYRTDYKLFTLERQGNLYASIRLPYDELLKEAKMSMAAESWGD